MNVIHTSLVTDLDAGRRLWESLMPRDLVTDLWEVRDCFWRHYRRRPCFVVASESGRITGFLPLCWIDEAGVYAYFPGETWQGRTWLEQNRIVAETPAVLDALLAAIPGDYHVRYLLPPAGELPRGMTVDEIGYLFHPGEHNFDLETYFNNFSHRRLKRLRRELTQLEGGASYRHDDPADLEHLVRLNCERFGERSYFADARFLEGFRSLTQLLRERGWFRMTAIVSGGEPVAVDLGCLYKNTYTLLGGGTHAAYPGIAKLINIHHMERACRERIDTVDFLCGDFSWKTLFHLTPRPLYMLSTVAVPAPEPASDEAIAQQAPRPAGWLAQGPSHAG